MRIMIALLLITLCVDYADAQKKLVESQEDDAFEFNFNENESPASEKFDAKDHRESNLAERQFKIHVFMNEPSSTQAVLKLEKVIKQVNRPVVETRRVNGRDMKVTRFVAEQITQQVESVTSGVSIISCDEIELQVTVNEEGEKKHSFDVKSKLLLRNGSSVLEADSAKLSDGKLTLSNVVATTSGMKMESAEIVIQLKVNNFRIGDQISSQTSTDPTPVYSDQDQLEPLPFASPESTGFPSNPTPFDEPVPFPAEDSTSSNLFQ